MRNSIGKKVKLTIAKWHYRKRFEPEVVARWLGIELEWPLVSLERGGSALNIGEVREIFARIKRQDPELHENMQGSLLLEKMVKPLGGGAFTFPQRIHPETGISTLEVSFAPAPSIKYAAEMVNRVAWHITEAAQGVGAAVLGYGIQPFTLPSRELYSPMHRHVALKHIRSRMMQGSQAQMEHTTITAAAQFHVSTRDCEDAVRLMNIFNGFAPEFVLLSGNSKIMGGLDTGFVDLRSMLFQMHSVNSFFAGIAPRFRNFDEYFSAIKRMPVLFVQRGDTYYTIEEDITLEDFIIRGEATAKIPGYPAHYIVRFTYDDIATVLGSSIRWDARARSSLGTVEFRTVSMQPSVDDIMALGSLVLGIASNHNIEMAEELLSHRSEEETRIAKHRAAKWGAAGYRQGVEYAKNLLDLASQHFAGNNSYIKKLYERLHEGMTPAEQSYRTYAREGAGAFLEQTKFKVNA